MPNLKGEITRFKKYCLCLPLDSGVAIIGSLTLIGALAIVAFSTNAFYQITVFFKGNPHLFQDPKDLQHIKNMRILYSLIIVSTVALMANNITMIFGVRTKNLKLLMNCALVQLIAIVCATVSYIWFVVSAFYCSEGQSFAVYLIIIGIPVGALHIYYSYIVLDTYREIRVEKSNLDATGHSHEYQQIRSQEIYKNTT